MTSLRLATSLVDEALINGLCYFVDHENLLIAKDASEEILIKVGANDRLTVIFGLSTSLEFTAELFETPTIVGDGTSLPVISFNRAVINAIDSTFFHTPNTSADGTLLADDINSGGNIRNQIFGLASQNGSFPWILKEGINYLIRLTNTSGVKDQYASLHMGIIKETV